MIAPFFLRYHSLSILKQQKVSVLCALVWPSPTENRVSSTEPLHVNGVDSSNVWWWRQRHLPILLLNVVCASVFKNIKWSVFLFYTSFTGKCLHRLIYFLIFMVSKMFPNLKGGPEEQKLIYFWFYVCFLSGYASPPNLTSYNYCSFTKIPQSSNFLFCACIGFC